MAEPKISKDKSVRFHTRALPCFNEIYDFFYFEGKKPRNLRFGAPNFSWAVGPQQNWCPGIFDSGHLIFHGP
jgi:hypothetical protein